MDENADLDAYNGDAEHDMWVDYDYNENTGELSDLFYDNDIDDINKTQNDCTNG